MGREMSVPTQTTGIGWPVSMEGRRPPLEAAAAAAAALIDDGGARPCDEERQWIRNWLDCK